MRIKRYKRQRKVQGRRTVEYATVTVNYAKTEEKQLLNHTTNGIKNEKYSVGVSSLRKEVNNHEGGNIKTMRKSGTKSRMT